MQERNYNTRKLIKLVDSFLTFAKLGDDIRGRKVIDQNFKDIGTINALYIDEVEGKVRFLRVTSGGIFGIGESTFLIPVETITKVTGDEVDINVKKSHIAKAPGYDPELVEEKYLEELHGYYGLLPFWYPVDSR